jgi:RND family efflux transporter MFP subunit
MRRRLGWTLIALIVIAAAAALAIRFWPRPDSQQAGVETAAPPAPTGTVKFLMEQQWAIRMKLAKAEPTTVARQVTATGRVVPAAGRRALAAPPVGGVIVDGPLPRLGQQIRRGETIAVLQQVPTAAEVAQIAAGHIEETRLEVDRRRAEEAIKEADVRLAHARREFERAERLFERKVYARRQLDAAETDYRAAEAAQAAAVAHRDALRDSRTAATPRERVVTTHTVLAPISGTVVRVSKAIGEQVAPGDAIVEIVNLDTVWIDVPVFESDLARIARPIRAVFTTSAAPGKEFSGTLVDLGAVIDREARAATLVFEVPNAGRPLRIGLQANARIDAGERADVVMVFREALLEAEGKRFVYVLRTGEEFERREVTVGDEYGARVAVLRGLEPGERVVTQGAWQIRQQELRPAGGGAHVHE